MKFGEQMNWKNGRKLNDEWENIKSWHFDPRPSEIWTQDEVEEQAELSLMRERLRINQSR